MGLKDDLSDVLTSGGFSPTPSKDFLPATPDSAVALFEYGGPPPVYAMTAGPNLGILERPHVQLLSRDLRPDTARKVAQDAVKLLGGLGRVVNGVTYGSVYPIQSPFFLERDGTGRVTYAVNFEVQRVPASSS